MEKRLLRWSQIKYRSRSEINLIGHQMCMEKPDLRLLLSQLTEWKLMMKLDSVLWLNFGPHILLRLYSGIICAFWRRGNFGLTLHFWLNCVFGPNCSSLNWLSKSLETHCAPSVQQCSIGSCWRCLHWAWGINPPTCHWSCRVAFYRASCVYVTLPYSVVIKPDSMTSAVFLLRPACACCRYSPLHPGDVLIVCVLCYLCYLVCMLLHLVQIKGASLIFIINLLNVH